MQIVQHTEVYGDDYSGKDVSAALHPPTPFTPRSILPFFGVPSPSPPPDRRDRYETHVVELVLIRPVLYQQQPLGEEMELRDRKLPRQAELRSFAPV